MSNLRSKWKTFSVKRYTVLFTFDFFNGTIQNLMKIRKGGQKFVHSPLFAVIVRILFSSLISVKHATLQYICCMFVKWSMFRKNVMFVLVIRWGLIVLYLRITICHEEIKTIWPCLCALNPLSCRVPCITNKPVLDKVTQTDRFTHVR